MVHIYNGILLSHKKEWNNAICSNMDRPSIIILRKVNKKDKADITWYHIYVENKFMVTGAWRQGKTELRDWDWHTHYYI